MLAPISTSSNGLQQYRKHPSLGPRELTPAMVRSIDEADKPIKRGKKPENQKQAQVSKPTKGKTPKKRKYDRAVTSPPKPKKLKKPDRRLILQSSSDSDSEYVPPQHKITSPSEYESECSNDEASGRGDTPPRSPTPEIPVLSHPPSPPHVTIVVSIPPIFLFQPLNHSLQFPSLVPYSQTLPLPQQLLNLLPLLHHVALTSAAKAIEASTSQCQQASIAVDASTKECKEATAKFDKLVSEAHLFLDSLQAAAAKNTQTVNALVENLQRSLQSERSNLEAA
ncbi:unnamed protein product [Lactuca saligna]|uniref:Uncharacterized protein n=1 Tax=Lactuca saligna TaxID=75948 RepID=A0AA35ZWB9_LACSI|nr:unnamed protein product [Lactuca saligna]